MAIYAARLAYTNNDELRTEVRPTHREYLRELLDAGKLHESGPFADDSGALIVYNADSQGEAEALLAADPFTKSGGIIESAVVKEWKIVMSAGQN
jgi:uncharacterized protein